MLGRQRRELQPHPSLIPLLPIHQLAHQEQIRQHHHPRPIPDDLFPGRGGDEGDPDVLLERHGAHKGQWGDGVGDLQPTRFGAHREYVEHARGVEGGFEGVDGPAWGR